MHGESGAEGGEGDAASDMGRHDDAFYLYRTNRLRIRIQKLRRADANGDGFHTVSKRLGPGGWDGLTVDGQRH